MGVFVMIQNIISEGKISRFVVCKRITCVVMLLTNDNRSHLTSRIRMILQVAKKKASYHTHRIL